MNLAHSKTPYCYLMVAWANCWGAMGAAAMVTAALPVTKETCQESQRVLPLVTDQRLWWTWQRIGQCLGQDVPIQVGDKLVTPYGIYTVHHALIAELCNHRVMKRIHGIRQYGVGHFAYGGATSYTRWKHCMGVMVLLHRFGASLAEEVAGGLHDVSHTVFSHAGDFFFRHQSHTSSYQDEIHAWYLQQLGVDFILAKHGLRLEQVDHERGGLRMLDQDLPDLCADRLEYNIRAGLDEGLLYPEEIEELLQALQFANGTWFFTDAYWAARLGRVSLLCTQKIWGGIENALTNELLCEALRRAITLGHISLDTIYHGTDDVVWHLLQSIDDVVINGCLEAIGDIQGLFISVPNEQAHRVITAKFRGINPLVQDATGALVRLTDCDQSYAREFAAVKRRMSNGWPIIYTPRGLALLATIACAASGTP